MAGASCRRAHYTEWIDCPVWLFSPVICPCGGLRCGSRFARRGVCCGPLAKLPVWTRLVTPPARLRAKWGADDRLTLEMG